jgi:hypothetical protein
VVQTALSWVGVSNKTIRVLYSHDSDTGILHCPVMQAGHSLVMRYSTRGVNMPLSSAVVRLNVSSFVISFTCWSCFLLTVTLQISHLRMIDHQRIRPPPRFCPCIAVPLPLRARWLVTIQKLICKMGGAVTASDFSEPWINTHVPSSFSSFSDR